MKSMNNITGEYQALPEEMLSKREVLFIQFALRGVFKIPRASGRQTASAMVGDFIKPFQCLLYLSMYILFNER